MAFFTPEFTKFFKSLEKNNSTDWFDKNRKVYENEVKKPFAALVTDMIARIAKHEPEVKIKAADAIMRINKDIRFSKDKTPYNTHVGANISAFGKKDKGYPGFFFQLSPKSVSIFGGAYMVEPDRLAKIRKLIGSKHKDFREAINDKKFKDKFGSIKGDQSKRLDPDLKALADKEPLAANKQFYYSAELKPDVITSDKLPEILMEYYLAARNVNAFLKNAWK